MKKIISFIRFLINLFPPVPLPRPPEVRTGYRRYWDDAEWDAYREKVLRKNLP